ncbi:MAG: MATE family efflux transporter [Oscillospiraceae bacterium]|nr:MATE family efflux transporter [Oscillospiraceae bacterium]
MNTLEKNPFTSGPIFAPLLKFMLPVLLANLLQAMYSAVDLMVIGRFAAAETLQLANAAVGTGSMIMVMVTFVINGLAMGTTVILGQYIGAKDREGASKVIGSAICIFVLLAAALTAAMEALAPLLASWMNAPSVEMTTQYIRICGGGLLFITAYNVISSIFRGIGNSKLPLLFVGIACVVNIVLDLFTVCVLHWDVAGVAVSTITAQAVSVVLSLVVIKRIDLPFYVSAGNIRFHKVVSSKILKAGIPLAFQDLLTNLSFVIINTVANQLGSDATAWAAIASGYAVDNKLTTFAMIVPTAFLQSMAVFTAQNVGAGNRERIQKGLRYMLLTAAGVGVLLFLVCIFCGSLMASVFTDDAETIGYAAQYLKGYSLDCLICAAMLTMLGYFNGCGHATFVLVQGLIGSFVIRIPLILLLKGYEGVTLTHLGLGCASATIASLILCIGYYAVKTRKGTMFPASLYQSKQTA